MTLRCQGILRVSEVLKACQPRRLIEGTGVLKAFFGLDMLGKAFDAVNG